MSVIIDRLVSVGLGKESSRGTAVAPSHWVPHQEFSFQDRVEKAVDNSAIGRIEDAFAADVVSQWAEGTLSGNIYADSFGLLLLAALGTVNSAANADASGSVYDHTFSVNNTNQHPSLTIAAKDANEDLAYALGMLQSLEVVAELNQFVRYNASFISKASASGSHTAAFAAEPRFRAQDVVVKMADTVAGLSAATATKLRSATITLNKNAETDFALGSVDVDGIYNRNFQVSVSMEALYRDNTWAELVRNGSSKALSISFVNSGATIGTAANPTLTFTFQPGSFNPRDLAGGLDDLKTETLEFQGLFSMSQTKMLEVVLTNTETSY